MIRFAVISLMLNVGPAVALDLIEADCFDQEANAYHVLRPISPDLVTALVTSEYDPEPELQTVLVMNCETQVMVRATNRVEQTGRDWPELRKLAEVFAARKSAVDFHELANTFSEGGFAASVEKSDTAVCDCLTEASE